MQPSNTAVYTCSVKLLGQTPDNNLPEVPTSFELLVYKKPVIPAFDLNQGVVSGSYNFTLPQDADPTLGIAALDGHGAARWDSLQSRHGFDLRQADGFRHLLHQDHRQEPGGKLHHDSRRS